MAWVQARDGETPHGRWWFAATGVGMTTRKYVRVSGNIALSTELHMYATALCDGTCTFDNEIIVITAKSRATQHTS